MGWCMGSGTLRGRAQRRFPHLCFSTPLLPIGGPGKTYPQTVGSCHLVLSAEFARSWLARSLRVWQISLLAH